MEPLDEPNEQKIQFHDTDAKDLKHMESARSVPDKEIEYDEAATRLLSSPEKLALR